MKKTLYILTFLIAVSSCFAQLEYHNWLFGDHGYYGQKNYLNGITFMTESGSPEFLNIELPYNIDSALANYEWKFLHGSGCISNTNGVLEYYSGNSTLISFNPDSIISENKLFPLRTLAAQSNSLVTINNKTVVLRTMSRFGDGSSTLPAIIRDLSFFVISRLNDNISISEVKAIKKNYKSKTINVIKDLESESFYLIAHDRIEGKYFLYKYDIQNETFINKDILMSNLEHLEEIKDEYNHGFESPLKVSPNGKYIVSMISNDHTRLEILKFNRNIEKLEILKTYNESISNNDFIKEHSGEFSQNGDHFYLIGKYMHALTNFNNNDEIKIQRVSDDRIDFNLRTYLQLGPDGNIYTPEDNDYISVIKNTNDLDKVEYVRDVIDLKNTSGDRLIPNIPVSYYYQIEVDKDSLELCIGDSLFVETSSLNEPEDTEYIWTAPNGNEYKMKNLKIDSVERDMSGVFKLSAITKGYHLKREVYVKVLGPEFELDTYRESICEGDTNTIYIKNPYVKKVSQSVLWSTGDTTRGTVIHEPGVYSVAVTDFDGCTVTEEIEIFDSKPEIAINPLRPTIFCSGDSTVLEVVPYDDNNSYTWSTGETSQQIVVKTKGTYSVIVEEGENCKDTAYVEIKVEDNLQPTIVGSDICEGETATLEALPNDPSYSYEWSNGETTPTIIVSQPATYTVTVSKDGCSGTAEFEVYESPNPEFEILGEDIVCGSIATLSPDQDFADYLWSTDEVTKEIEVTEAGTYSLTVTDENGCSATEEFTVKEQSLSFDISKDRIDFGKVYISENATDSAEIVNTSGFDITIQSGDEQYRILDGQTVQYNKTLNPTELGPYADSFEYRVIEPCDTVITIPVTAEVYAIATISSDNIETEIGAEVSIPVYLKAKADLGEQTYSITTGIDQSVLFTNDNFTFTNTAPINESKTKIYEISAMIMLASELEYDITFPSYEFNNPYIEVNTEQGSITIDSVCAFPFRSVNITDATEMKVSPNPAKDKLVVDVHSEENTIMTLELISSEGRVAYSENWTQTVSEKQLNINTDKIPSGLYQVRLQTPSGVLTENVIVVR